MHVCTGTQLESKCGCHNDRNNSFHKLCWAVVGMSIIMNVDSKDVWIGINAQGRKSTDDCLSWSNQYWPLCCEWYYLSTRGCQIFAGWFQRLRKLQDQWRYTMALTIQNPFALTLVKSHTTPFVPTGTDIACLAEDTGHFPEIDLKETHTTCILQYKRPLTCRWPHWTLNEWEKSDEFSSE